MQIIEIEKLVQSQAATVAAARGVMSLIERGLSRYGHAWNKPAIAAILAGECVGILCLEPDTDEKSVTVRLAWCDKRYPTVLAVLLTRLRSWCADKGFSEVFFTAHDENDDMAKAAALFQASTYSRTYRIVL